MITREKIPLMGRQPLATPPASGGGCLIVVGIPFLLAGMAIILGSMGGIPIKMKGGGAPPPSIVIGLTGFFFGLVGFGLMWSGVKSRIAFSRFSAAKSLNANQPWEFDYAWDRTGCRLHKAKDAFGSFVAFIGMGLFLTPFNWWAFFSTQTHVVVIGVVGLFDLILLGILCHGVYTLLQAAKYGDPFLRFEKFPYYTGEKLSVSFEPSRPLGEFRSVEIILRCVRVEKVEVRSSKGGRHTEDRCFQVYAEELKIEQAGSMDNTALPLSFEVPINVAGTSLAEEPVRFWELQIKADTPGIDFDAEFPLPIYSKSR